MVRIGRPQERLLGLSDFERNEMERISRSLSAPFLSDGVDAPTHRHPCARMVALAPFSRGHIHGEG